MFLIQIGGYNLFRHFLESRFLCSVLYSEDLNMQICCYDLMQNFMS